MKQPFFTLITPVYNIEKLIAATIESALSQTFTDWEMVLIDDGSPDNAGKICDEYAAKDERIKVVHKQNEGLAEARNVGIRNTTGKYFMIFEGSDLFPENTTLEKIYDVLKDGKYDIYFGKLQDVLENSGKVVGEQADYCVNGEFIAGGKLLFSKLYDNEDYLAMSSPVNKVFRSDFVKGNDLWFYKGIYHDDDEWLPRAISLSDKCYFTNEVIYNALTWDGCLGLAVSEKSLTKKGCDKMFIANRCIKDIYYRFNGENSPFIKKYTEYYVRMYIGGACNLNKVHDEDLRAQLQQSIKDNSAVFSYMKNCESKNLRLLAKLRKILGLKLAIKMLLKRYAE